MVFLVKKIGDWILHPPGDLSNKSNYYRDLSYNLCLGASQPALGAIAIIIIKQVLSGSNNLIGVVQSASMAGLLLSLFYRGTSLQQRPQKAYVKPHMFGWLSIMCCAFTEDVFVFTFLVFLSLFLFHISSPAQGVLYQLIYSSRNRGRIVSYIKLLQLIVAALFSLIIGQVIEHHGFAYQGFYLGLGLCGIICSYLFMKIEIPEKNQTIIKKRPFPNIVKIFYHDRPFLLFMAFQFLLGTANIAGFSAIQVYINDKSFLGLSPEKAAFIAGVVVPTAMFLSMIFWGKSFDRLPIVRYRIITSCVLGIGFIPFLSGEFWGALLGSAIWGIGRGGGQLAWTLGVLDFAPKNSESEYLGIHTFLTGLRGTIAPFVGVYLIESLGGSRTLLFSSISILIFISALCTFLFVTDPGRRHHEV